LPRAVEGVRLEDLRRVAVTWLGSEQRTVGWYVPDSPHSGAVPAAAAVELAAKPAEAQRPVAAAKPEPAGAPVVRTLDNGTVAIVQRSPLSPTAHLKLVLAGAVDLGGTEVGPNDPAWGVTSLDLELLPQELDTALAGMAARLGQTVTVNLDDSSDANDPQARLERHFRDTLGLQAAGASGPGEARIAVAPLLVVVSGDVEPGAALWAVAQAFGDFPPAGSAGMGESDAALARPNSVALRESGRMEVESTLELPVAQEQLGYVVPAPGPAEPAAAAWQMALYVLTHGYEGRLGKEAISKRGLVYYIDSAYRSDRRRGWVTLSMGVDPDKLPAMRELLREELARLVSEPPTQADLDEARRHLLGRQLSAAQSNRELADRLAREWLWHGALPGYEDLQARLERVTLQDLLDALPAFTAGTIVAVRNPSAEPGGRN
jgi:hypothetical protein